MYCYYEQGILVGENENYAQRLPFQVLLLDFKFHIDLLVRIVNHFSPVKDIENVDDIYFARLHLLFNVPGESYPFFSLLGNPPYLCFDFLYIYYHHSSAKLKRKN
jgi:hypothetical protein